MNLVKVKANGLEFSYLKSEQGSKIFQKIIRGKIINSVPSPNDQPKLTPWKQNIAKAVFDSKNQGYFSPENHYAISLSMKFCPSLHGNHKLDVENYIKPILDGIAAGLFCPKEQDPTQIVKFNYDDSNFDKLFVEKLPNALDEKDELIVISIFQN